MMGRLVVALVPQRIAAVAGTRAVRRRPRMGRNMAWLLGAAFVSSAGDWMYRLALPLLVYEMTGSAALTAFTYALEYLPYVVLSPLAGLMADRMDRRRLLIRGDALAAGVLTGLVVSLAVGLDGVLIVYAAAALLAIISPFYHPAIQALVPAVVDAGDLTVASARLQSVDSVVSLAGPLIGGAVIVALGTHDALLLDAASFAVSALCIAAIRTARAAKDLEEAPVRVRAGLAEAASFIHRDRMILSGAVLFTGANFALFLVQANLVYYLTAVRGFAPSTLGLVFSAEGAGALAGALVAPAFERRWGAGRVILGSTVAAGLLTLPLLWVTDPATVSLVCALEAAAGMVTVVTWFSLRLQRVPDKMLGRVVALTRMVAFAAIPVAAVVGGLFLTATREFTPLILTAAGVQIALGALGVLGPMNQPREAQYAA
jgi:MFS family permease